MMIVLWFILVGSAIYWAVRLGVQDGRASSPPPAPPPLPRPVPGSAEWQRQYDEAARASQADFDADPVYQELLRKARKTQWAVIDNERIENGSPVVVRRYTKREDAAAWISTQDPAKVERDGFGLTPPEDAG